MYIGDLSCAQGAGERLAVELGIVAGTRDRTNVYYTLNAVRLQDLKEVFQRPVRVSDCEHRGIRIFASGGQGLVRDTTTSIGCGSAAGIGKVAGDNIVSTRKRIRR